MAGRILLDACNPALDSSGNVDSSATLTFYENGTVTSKAVYTSPSLATALSNPLSCDGAGRFPMVWAPDGELYSVKWTPGSGSPITFNDIVALGDTQTRQWLELESYGAKLDGTTDDTDAWEAFFADVESSGKIGRVGPGVSVHRRNLVVPKNCIIAGSGIHSTVLKPTSAVTSAISQLAGSVLTDIGIDGANTSSGAVGHDLGGYTVDGSGAYGKVNGGSTIRVYAYNFGSSDSYGGRCQRVDAWDYHQCFFWGDNYHGFRMGGFDEDADIDKAPTEIRMYGCYFKQNKHRGIDIRTGNQIDFFGGSVELNGDAGVYADTSFCTAAHNPTARIYFHAFHFEQNQQNLYNTPTPGGGDARTGYSVDLDGSGEFGAVVNFGFIKCRFVCVNDARYSRAIKSHSVRDLLIDAPEHLNISAAIKLLGGGDGAIVNNWLSASGDLSTAIDDQSGYGSAKFLYEAHGDFDPLPDITAATPGNLSISWNTRKATWFRRGKRMRCDIELQFVPTHTTASGALLLTNLPRAATSRSGTPYANGTARFNAVYKPGYSTFWSYIAPGSSSIGFLANEENTAVSVINIGNLVSGVSVQIFVAIEYEVA